MFLLLVQGPRQQTWQMRARPPAGDRCLPAEAPRSHAPPGTPCTGPHHCCSVACARISPLFLSCTPSKLIVSILKHPIVPDWPPSKTKHLERTDKGSKGDHNAVLSWLTWRLGTLRRPQRQSGRCRQRAESAGARPARSARRGSAHRRMTARQPLLQTRPEPSEWPHAHGQYAANTPQIVLSTLCHPNMAPDQNNDYCGCLLFPKAQHMTAMTFKQTQAVCHLRTICMSTRLIK